MKLSKPRAYIKILLNDIQQLTEAAVSNSVNMKFQGGTNFTCIQESFKEEMNKVENIKEEILNIVSEMDPE